MHIGKRITAGLLALLLFAGLSLPVCAAEADASDAESAAASEKVADIRVTVSIFENIGRSWILAPMQIGIPGDGGLQELMDTLIRYAYLEDAVVSDGNLLSLTTADGSVYKQDARKEHSWLLIRNGIEYEAFSESTDENAETVPFAFAEGDSIQLVFSSGSAADTELSAASAPSRALSSTTDTIPWEDDYDTEISTSCSWLKNNSDTPVTLTVLGAAGTSVDHKYLTRVLRGILEEEENPDGLTLAEDILCVSFSGISAENFSGQNLLDELISIPDLTRMATAAGLLAYDCNNYSVPADALNSRDAMINVIMAAQNEDGGIASQRGEKSDLLLTALSLTALAPYRDDEAVSPCIEKAIEWLSAQQKSDGGYYSSGYSSCTMTSAVILALNSLSIPLSDERFCSGDNNLMTALQNYYVEGAGFSERKHEETDETATGLAVLALCSQKTDRNPLILRSLITGSGSIDLTSSEETEEEEPASQPVLDEETRKSFRIGLVGAVIGSCIGVFIMLGVLIRLKNKYGHSKKTDDPR